jgi:hypothetical protein
MGKKSLEVSADSDINHMPVVIAFRMPRSLRLPDLEPDSVDFEMLINQQTHRCNPSISNTFPISLFFLKAFQEQGTKGKGNCSMMAW